MNYKTNIKTALSGLKTIGKTASVIIDYLSMIAVLFLMLKAIWHIYPQHYDLGKTIAYAGISVMAILWAILWELKDGFKKQQPIMRIRLPKDLFKDDGRMEKSDPGFNQQSETKPFAFKWNTTAMLMNSWIRFAKKTFSKATAHSHMDKLREEVSELQAAVTNRDDSDILKQGVDVMFVTMSLLGLRGYTAEDIHNAMADKHFINTHRNWKQNENDTYSHVDNSEPQQPAYHVTANRVFELMYANFNNLPSSEAMAVVSNAVCALADNAPLTDAGVLVLIENEFLVMKSGHRPTRK